MAKQQTIDSINDIMKSQDGDKSWDFFELDFTHFSEDEQVLMAMDLFEQNWHKLHENLASWFQQKRNPLAIDLLYKIAFRADLDIFDYKPLARKCVWALADIGTVEAKEYLQKMAVSGDKIIEDFAQKRLDNWEDELSRKGTIKRANIRK
jgi:hypothetical protein